METFVQTCLDACRELLSTVDTIPVPRSRALALLNMAVVNKEASALLQAEPLWRYASAFLYSLLKPEATIHFFDGIPPSIPLLEGVHGTRNVNGNTARNHFRFAASGAPCLTKRGTVGDRHSTAMTLAANPVTELSVSYGCFDIEEALHPFVPIKLRMFWGRARLFAQGLAAHRSEAHFGACRTCQRRVFVGSLLLTDDEDEERHVDETDTSARYWNASGGTYPTPAAFLFCSQSCARVHRSEVELAMGIQAVELEEYDAPDSKSGIARVGSALRAAFKRNELVARRMRSVKANDFKLLSPEEVSELQTRTVMMLNTDVGLLIACATIAETAVGRMRPLPPTYHFWRRVELIYVSSLFRVRVLYDRFGDAGSLALIQHAACQSRFVAKCRSEAQLLFA
jgi:hypothetical protein